MNETVVIASGTRAVVYCNKSQEKGHVEFENFR